MSNHIRIEGGAEDLAFYATRAMHMMGEALDYKQEHGTGRSVQAKASTPGKRETDAKVSG
jgi:hypothetical protein